MRGDVADVLDEDFVNQRLAQRGLGRGDFTDRQPRLLLAARNPFAGGAVSVGLGRRRELPLASQPQRFPPFVGRFLHRQISPGGGRRGSRDVDFLLSPLAALHRRGVILKQRVAARGGRATQDRKVGNGRRQTGRFGFRLLAEIETAGRRNRLRQARIRPGIFLGGLCRGQFGSRLRQCRRPAGSRQLLDSKGIGLRIDRGQPGRSRLPLLARRGSQRRGSRFCPKGIDVIIRDRNRFQRGRLRLRRCWQSCPGSGHAGTEGVGLHHLCAVVLLGQTDAPGTSIRSLGLASKIELARNLSGRTDCWCGSCRGRVFAERVSEIRCVSLHQPQSA